MVDTSQVQSIDHDTYKAAREGAALFSIPNAAYFYLTGETRVDYLQRQTTNDIRALAEGHVLSTVLTTPTARIIDVLTLVYEEAAKIGLIPLSDRGTDTLSYFQSRVFFNDKVKFEDVSDRYVQFALLGPQVDQVLHGANLPIPEDLDQMVRSEVNGAPIAIYRTHPNQVRLLIAIDSASNVMKNLLDAGATETPLAPYDVLRIEQGIPGYHEMSEDYTPLEIGLRRFISDAKGCYTGQEVIARQITYDKVTKQLVGLRLAKLPLIGAELRSEGKKAGKVTSVGISPTLGPIALAVVKNDFAQPETMLTLEEGVSAQVSTLPFTL